MAVARPPDGTCQSCGTRSLVPLGDGLQCTQCGRVVRDAWGWSS